jgi:hypothetical protein
MLSAVSRHSFLCCLAANWKCISNHLILTGIVDICAVIASTPAVKQLGNC